MPISPLFAQALRHTEEAWSAQDIWDLSPQFFAFIPPGIIAIDLPEQLWERVDFHPVPMMTFLANNWQHRIGPHLHKLAAQQHPGVDFSPLTGIMIIYEAWGFDNRRNPIPASDLPELLAIAEEGLVHAHPGRIEMRQVIGIDLTGDFMMLTRARGETQATTEHIMGEGAVIDAAKEFAAALAKLTG